MPLCYYDDRTTTRRDKEDLFFDRVSVHPSVIPFFFLEVCTFARHKRNESGKE